MTGGGCRIRHTCRANDDNEWGCSSCPWIGAPQEGGGTAARGMPITTLALPLATPPVSPQHPSQPPGPSHLTKLRLAAYPPCHPHNTHHCWLDPNRSAATPNHTASPQELNVTCTTLELWRSPPPRPPCSRKPRTSAFAMRSLSSLAALLVKVTTMISLAATPRDSSHDTWAATTRVLPLPGPALTRTA